MPNSFDLQAIDVLRPLSSISALQHRTSFITAHASKYPAKLQYLGWISQDKPYAFGPVEVLNNSMHQMATPPTYMLATTWILDDPDDSDDP